MTTLNVKIPGFAGEVFVALAGREHAVAGCAPGIAHPAEQHTFSEAVHTPIKKPQVQRSSLLISLIQKK